MKSTNFDNKMLKEKKYIFMFTSSYIIKNAVETWYDDVVKCH